jgi:hypothetical protein
MYESQYPKLEEGTLCNWFKDQLIGILKYQWLSVDAQENIINAINCIERDHGEAMKQDIEWTERQPKLDRT